MWVAAAPYFSLVCQRFYCFLFVRVYQLQDMLQQVQDKFQSTSDQITSRNILSVTRPPMHSIGALDVVASVYCCLYVCRVVYCAQMVQDMHIMCI